MAAAGERRVGVLGCGWLGLPLAQALLKQGWTVHGSTTSPARVPELRAAGVRPWVLRVSEQVLGEDADAFFAVDALVINIPPGRGSDVETAHPRQVAALIAAAGRGGCRHAIFVSSTSVYAACNARVHEEDATPPEKGSGRALRAAEALLRAQSTVDVTILRLAGLIGPGRLPGHFLAGKRDVAGGDAPVNLIHRDDAIGLILCLLARGGQGEVFNGVAPSHPTRRAYYTRAAAALGLPAPTFAADAAAPWKIVDHRKAETVLGYRFAYPEPDRCFTGDG